MNNFRVTVYFVNGETAYVTEARTARFAHRSHETPEGWGTASAELVLVCFDGEDKEVAMFRADQVVGFQRESR